MTNQIVQDPLLWRQWYGDTRRRWGWWLFLGVLFVLGGLAGLGSLLAATVAGVLLFAVLLLVGGAIHLTQVFTGSGTTGRGVQFLIAALYLALGVLVLLEPAAATISLTLFLGVMLLAVGLLRVFAGLQMRGLPTWGWVTFVGVLDIVLGALIVLGLPGTGFWVIGLFISLELLFAGMLFIVAALEMRRHPDQGGSVAR